MSRVFLRADGRREAGNMANRLYTGHYLLSCRLDNWLRLLRENKLVIARERVPQALLISLSSLLLSPFALAESAIFGRRIRRHSLAQDPVFIIGHWRSGTTYLQNILSRDPQFGWADPVSTAAFPNCLLLGWLLSPIIAKSLRGARPMDNLEYSLNLPIEETFALMTVSTRSLLHLIAFPADYGRYTARTFVDDFPQSELRAWEKEYDFVLRKLSYVCKGRQLLLKSPDNTAHLPALRRLYPNARYINIHRDPYITVRSTMHMFKKQMELMRLSPLPNVDFEDAMETEIVAIFERMYRELFTLKEELPQDRFAELAYEDFVKEPIDSLSRIYKRLGIAGFEAARPSFEAYAESQKSYIKNKFEISSRLRQKINARLGFYFAHYGYEMREEINQ